MTLAIYPTFLVSRYRRTLLAAVHMSLITTTADEELLPTSRAGSLSEYLFASQLAQAGNPKGWTSTQATEMLLRWIVVSRKNNPPRDRNGYSDPSPTFSPQIIVFATEELNFDLYPATRTVSYGLR